MEVSIDTESFPSGAKIADDSKTLKKILLALDTKNLLNGRLVTRKWNRFITEILVQRESIMMGFSRVDSLMMKPGPHLYKIRVGHKFRDHETLHDLTDFLKVQRSMSNPQNQAIQFPCVSFSLHCGNLGRKEVEEFFDIYGPQVRSLYLILSLRNIQGDEVDYSRMEEFEKLLKDQVLNLKSLELHTITNSWLDESTNLLKRRQIFNNVCLSSLKILNLGRLLSTHPEFVGQILEVAPNLQVYKTFDIKHVDLFVKTGKIGTVKNLVFCPDNSTIDHFAKFAMASPKLRKIVFSVYFPLSSSLMIKRVSSILVKILESSQDSLKAVSFQCLLGFLSVSNQDDEVESRWPALSRVKKIVVAIEYIPGENQEEFENFLIPQNYNWSQIFPTQHELSLNCLSTSFFPISSSTNNFSVTWLSIDFTFCSEMLTWNLATILPCVQRLEVYAVENGLTDFPAVCPWILGFRRLTRLEICLWVSDRISPNNSFPHLDSVFTGLSREDCIRLKDCPLFPCPEEMERLRGNSLSILDLKDLTYLGIKFYEDDCEEKQSYNLLSNVVNKAAFDLVPGLFVDISCMAHNRLNAIAMRESISSLLSSSSGLIMVRIEDNNKRCNHYDDDI